MKITFGHYCT